MVSKCDHMHLQNVMVYSVCHSVSVTFFSSLVCGGGIRLRSIAIFLLRVFYMAFLFLTSLHDVRGQHKKNWEATPTVSRWCHLKGIKLRNWQWLICCCLLQTCSFHHTVNLVQRKKKKKKQAMDYSLTVGEWSTFWLWILPVSECPW